jgi:hypothetical protein
VPPPYLESRQSPSGEVITYAMIVPPPYLESRQSEYVMVALNKELCPPRIWNQGKAGKQLIGGFVIQHLDEFLLAPLAIDAGHRRGPFGFSDARQTARSTPSHRHRAQWRWIK